MVCQLVAVAIFGWLLLLVWPQAQAHGAGASIFVVIAFATLHNSIGVVLASFGLFRISKGYVSRKRLLDLRIGQLWHGYSAAVGLTALAFPILLVALVGETSR